MQTIAMENDMGVLSKEESAILGRVKLTPEWAEQIWKRNTEVIEALDVALPLLLKGKKPDGWVETECADRVIWDGEAGCPHCKVVRTCQRCEWAAVPGQCGDTTFGGYSLNDMDCAHPLYLDFHTVGEFLCGYLGECKAQPKAAQECADAIRVFCNGHLEWVKAARGKSGGR